nr:MAG TPA: hypothetical protein [Caudoviricetes sp.]
MLLYNVTIVVKNAASCQIFKKLESSMYFGKSKYDIRI